MKRLLVGAICAVVGASAMADEWRLAVINENFAYLYNITSLRTERKYTSAWVVHAKRQKELNTDYYLSWTEFDCKQKKFRNVVSYGGVLNKTPFDIPSDTTWIIPPPGSMGEGLIGSVCERLNGDTFEENDAVDVTIAIRKAAKTADFW